MSFVGLVYNFFITLSFNDFVQYILLYLLFTPLIGCFCLFFISEYNILLLKKVSLYFAILNFIFSIILLLNLKLNCFFFQYELNLNYFYFFNLNFVIGVDGISILFIFLTTFLIVLCILISWNNINYYLKFYLILFFYFNEYFSRFK